jgi:uncharacterized repeat protein (TIGR03843 family)
MLPDEGAIAEHLRSGEVEVVGRMPWSSNGTYLCEVVHEGATRQAIYKPRSRERELWDFPSGLFQREVAAYELSRVLGWDLVPVTVDRDGPFGIGSLQDLVDADFEQHYFTLYEDEAHHPALRAMCVLDLVGNNTDRKSGHVLISREGRIQGIDHGLMFHHEFKLRTVIWEFGGEPIPAELLAAVAQLVEGELPDELACRLDVLERDALRTRARAVVDAGCFPIDGTGRRYPWPLV